jgi:hypothetical protein
VPFSRVDSGSPEHALTNNSATARRSVITIDLVAFIAMASFETGHQLGLGGR